MLPRESVPVAQKLRTAVAAGTRVRARGAVWRVDRTQPYGACTLVQLVGVSRENAHERRTLIHPFDHLTTGVPRTRLRVVSRRRWTHDLRQLVASEHPHDGLRAAAAADVDLLAYQLEPTLAVVRGLTCRVLLADDVGLGKTIQAGLLLAELRERGLAERTLIVAPAGLRQQWHRELKDRFSIDALVVDRARLRHRVSELPADANPWLIDDVAIVSLDLIKRAEALRGLTSITWDLLIVDEAHLAAPGTRRFAATRTLGARARRVALLSATPHTGNDEAFGALSRIGGQDSRSLAVFRRTRRQVGAGATRRVRILPVGLEAEEQDMHARLRRYTDAVMAGNAPGSAALLMAVLTKRALSSPVSLRVSLERRLRSLEHADGSPDDGQTQIPLPWLSDDDEDHDGRDLEPLELLRAPGLSDRGRERRLLADLLEAARTAGHGRKLAVLIRLVTRIRQPAIVFTEYRDTLHHIAGCLPRSIAVVLVHGGLNEAERVRAVSAFTDGSARLLLATDAAGEGLNLQARCRIVINVELPWNPMRLEQRIGRVDRIGQRGRVHAIHLVARHTAEATVLSRLATRLGLARRTFTDLSDPLGMNPDLARTVLDEADGPDRLDRHLVWRPNLGTEAATEARRLQAVRAWNGSRHQPAPRRAHAVVRSLPRIGAAAPGRATLWVLCAHLVDGSGGLVERCLVALLDTSAGRHPPPTAQPGPSARYLRARHRQIADVLDTLASAVAWRRADEISQAHRAAVEALHRRQQIVMAALEAERPAGELVQAGLFDNRAVRDHDVSAALRAGMLQTELERLGRIGSSRRLDVVPHPELVLVLSPREAR